MNFTMPILPLSIRTIASAFLLLLTAGASHAVVLDWTAVTWTAGTTASGSNSYDVDGGGNDITVAYTNSGATFAAVPSIAAVNGATDLKLGLSSMNSTTNSVSVTITFTGAYAGGVITSFTLNDVDANLASGGFRDKITIAALSGATPVAVTLTNSGGTSVNTISNSGTTSPSALGNTATSTNPQGDITISAGSLATPVNSITFTWTNPSTFFGTQTIGVGNISFVPEVAHSATALGLCAGLLMIGRRRAPRTAA